MTFITIGCLGFLVIHLFDVVSLKKVPAFKPLVWLAGTGMVVYAVIMLMMEPAKLSLPLWLTVIGWVMVVASLGLLVYSLFIDLPFKKTYLASGVGDELVKTGMYSLVRHPGVIWFSQLMIALVLVSQSSQLLLAVPIFIVLDVVLVVIQDKVFFDRMFDGYQAYRQETPMILPNRKSLYAFINSIKHLDI